MMQSSEDKEILAKILAGDSSAYAEIVRRYEGRILRLCFSMLSNEKEAEDAAQEIFLKAYYALNRFKGDSAFYTWLYRIAANHCLDLGKKKSRRPTESWDALLEKRGDEIERLLSTEAGTSATVESQELVHQVLSYLSPDHKLVLVLREMQGLNYEEIAASLHCSLDAVKGRLKRARQEFKEKLRHLLNSKTV